MIDRDKLKAKIHYTAIRGLTFFVGKLQTAAEALTEMVIKEQISLEGLLKSEDISDEATAHEAPVQEPAAVEEDPQQKPVEPDVSIRFPWIGTGTHPADYGNVKYDDVEWLTNTGISLYTANANFVHAIAEGTPDYGMVDAFINESTGRIEVPENIEVEDAELDLIAAKIADLFRYEYTRWPDLTPIADILMKYWAAVLGPLIYSSDTGDYWERIFSDDGIAGVHTQYNSVSKRLMSFAFIRIGKNQYMVLDITKFGKAQSGKVRGTNVFIVSSGVMIANTNINPKAINGPGFNDYQVQELMEYFTGEDVVFNICDSSYDVTLQKMH